MKAKPAKQTPLHNKNVISSIIAEKAKLSQEVKLEKYSSKIKPKLKAEVKVKNWEDDENDTLQLENVPPKEPTVEKSPVKVIKFYSFIQNSTVLYNNSKMNLRRISKNFIAIKFLVSKYLKIFIKRETN